MYENKLVEIEINLKDFMAEIYSFCFLFFCVYVQWP